MALPAALALVLAAAAFAVARTLPPPPEALRAPVSLGLVAGLLATAFHAAVASDLGDHLWEARGALVALFVLGASTPVWQVRPRRETGRRVAFDAATVGLALGTGVLLLQATSHELAGVAFAALLGLAGRWWLPHERARASLVLGVVAFLVPILLQGTAFPFRLREAGAAFAAGALISSLGLGFTRVELREWWLVAGAAVIAIAAGLAVQGAG